MNRCTVILTDRKESEDPEGFLLPSAPSEVLRDEVNFLQVKEEDEQTAQSIEGQQNHIPIRNRYKEQCIK